jgi:hypothetical protein
MKPDDLRSEPTLKAKSHHSIFPPTEGLHIAISTGGKLFCSAEVELVPTMCYCPVNPPLIKVEIAVNLPGVSEQESSSPKYEQKNYPFGAFILRYLLYYTTAHSSIFLSHRGDSLFSPLP